ncbi:MAG: NnrU family protein [Pseudomonadota bacterium]
MSLLIVGMALFFAVHLIPTAPALRRGLIAAFGAKAYQGFFVVGSLAGFVLLIWGMARAPVVEVWQTPAWGRYAAAPLMLLAIYCLVAKDAPSNLKRYTRHPMLWGVTLWALAHLLNNGDQAALLLFGGFLLYALYDMWSANRRGAEKSTLRYPLAGEAKTAAISLGVYAVLLWLHPYLFGVAVI